MGESYERLSTHPSKNVSMTNKSRHKKFAKTSLLNELEGI